MMGFLKLLLLREHKTLTNNSKHKTLQKFSPFKVHASAFSAVCFAFSRLYHKLFYSEF